MTRTHVAFPMPELRRLARQIAKRPDGASHAWMCSAWQLTPHQVNTRLDAMRRAGLVCYFRLGRTCVWTSPALANAMRKRLQAAKQAARREKNRQHNLIYWRARREAEAQEAAFTKQRGDMPVHRIVTAHQAPPLGKVGPSSVFDLAGTAT